jgi:hypothetical protein
MFVALHHRTDGVVGTDWVDLEIDCSDEEGWWDHRILDGDVHQIWQAARELQSVLTARELEAAPRGRANEEYIVCPTCHGHGQIVHPALSVWTQSDRYEDPEGFEGMMRGDYDVPCPECEGLRVVTLSRMQAYAREQADHRTYLLESGVYPGSPDWF